MSRLDWTLLQYYYYLHKVNALNKKRSNDSTLLEKKIIALSVGYDLVTLFSRTYP
jgi:hypothetical protein